MLLAIDTATSLAGIALLDAGGPRDALQWHTERNHTVELVPHIVALLARNSIAARDIRAIAVANGPGSYTGLRIGLSVAKGCCFVSGAALIGIPTLDITAQAYPPRADAVLCAVLQAGRGRLSACLYRASADGTHWEATTRIPPGRAEDLAAILAGQRVFFAGEVDAATEQTLRATIGDAAEFAPPDDRSRDPRVLARLGWVRWQAGQSDDVNTLAPDYGDNLA
ncbi:MAG: tRNA (adenosine(37)-N6)-threonylcarbamoyltransferase complex dimerization subunit type 1 TsaB [Chloroflexi bacterium]|nr:tRNA (adenosine(37)-N6)-threonylcarbamoyltransferase complex dimerization subunit type 1 TsaB [Chloroflexota bacterium]